LFRALQDGAARIRQGETRSPAVGQTMKETLVAGGVTEMEYATVADAWTLETPDLVPASAVLLVAARVGNTRLIDNLLVNVD
jgi:pantoate--beta-alanine ligase